MSWHQIVYEKLIETTEKNMEKIEWDTNSLSTNIISDKNKSTEAIFCKLCGNKLTDQCIRGDCRYGLK